jgi:hypothetical protein
VEESEKKDGRGSVGFLSARLRSHEFGVAQTSHALVFDTDRPSLHDHRRRAWQ